MRYLCILLLAVLAVGCSDDGGSSAAPDGARGAATLDCVPCAETGTKVNVWDSPLGTVLASYDHGDAATILDDQLYEGQTFYKVRMFDGLEGWLSSEWVRVGG